MEPRRMNAFERHQCVLRGQVPDKVDVVASTGLRSGPQGGWARRLAKRGLCLTHLVSPYRPYFSFPEEVNPCLKDVVYLQTTSYEDGAWQIRHVWETPVGSVEATAYRCAETPVASDSPRTHFVKKPEDWHIVNFVFRRIVASLQANYQAMIRDQDELGSEGYTIGVVGRTPYQRSWIELASLEETVLDCRSKPDGFLEYLDIQREFHNRVAEIAAECPSDQILLVDNITNTISPALYREYCAPYYEIYREAFRGTSKRLWVHHDGLLAHLKGEIAQAAFDVVDSFTVPPTGNLPLREARGLWPGKLISINLPPHLAFEGRDRLLVEYARLVEEWGSNLFVIEHVEDFPLEQVEAHLTAVLDVCGY